VAPEAEVRTASPAFRLAAWLQLGQAVLMELSVFLALPVLRIAGVDEEAVGERFEFVVPFFQENLYLLMVMSGVFGGLRLVGAVAVLRDRLWGLALTTIMCLVTLVLMVFLLPAGIVDGVLSGGALVLILRGWFGPASISGAGTPRRRSPGARR